MEYAIIEYEGQEARLYPDGSIRNAKGHWLVKHPDGHTITQGDASTLARTRYDRIREQIGIAVTERTGLPTEAEVVGAIVASRAQAALAGGREANGAARLVLDALDAMPRRESEVVHTHEYTMDAETAGLLREVLERRLVVDAEVRDVDG